MTERSIIELRNEAQTIFADNVVGDITASDLRNWVTDLLDTMTVAYAAAERTPSAFNVTTTPQKITPWTTQNALTAGFYTISLATGIITRLITSIAIAGGSDLIIVDGNVDGGSGDTITFMLYKNGVATGYTISVTTTGAGEPIGFNLAALVYTSGSDAAYELYVVAPSAGDTGTYNIDFNIIVQRQPVRSFV
jgi:hypothetical protein